MKNNIKLLILITLCGLALRLWGINFGLPYHFHADESHTVNISASLGYNLLDPKIFWKPALVYYLIAFQYGLYFLMGKAMHIFQSVDDFARTFVLNPTPFYLIVRISIGAIFGALSIPAIYLLGKKFYSKRTGIISALLLAVAFMHVQHSHYAAHDIPVLFFIMATVISAFDIYAKARTVDYIKAAVFFGLAVATKYNAALAIVSVLIAHMLNSREKKLRSLLLFAAVSSVTFLALNPYIMINSKDFIRTFGDLSATEGYTGFLHHIKVSLLQGVGFGIFVTGILGLPFIRKISLNKAALFLSVPFLYYIHLVFYSQYHERYVMVLIPFWLVLAAYFIDAAVDFMRQKRGYIIANGIGTVMVIAIAVPTLIKSIYSDILFSKKDTRVIAAEWIEQNLPAESRILFDHTFFCPAIEQSVSQLKEKKRLVRQKGLSGMQEKKLNILLEFAKNDRSPRYNIFYLGEDEGDNKNIYLFSSYPRISADKRDIGTRGIDYVVLSDMRGLKAKPSWLGDTSKLVKEISPYYVTPVFKKDEYVSVTAGPFTDKELFSRKNNGPYLRIYKFK